MSQISTLKSLFENNPNEWIPLPRILHLGIAQYNTRILELRDKDSFGFCRGMLIGNKTKRDGMKKHSWFKYIPRAEVN